jgi:hypothetical protein
MTRLRRKSSNNSSKYSSGAGSCFSGTSTVVDHCDHFDPGFYTDHASFSTDSSSTNPLHRLLTKISTLFSSDRSGTISDISSTEGTPLQKGTRDPSHNCLQRRSTQRKLIREALDSYAGETRVTSSSRRKHRAEIRLSLIQLPIQPIRLCQMDRVRYIGQTPSKHTQLTERRRRTRSS